MFNFFEIHFQNHNWLWLLLLLPVTIFIALRCRKASNSSIGNYIDPKLISHLLASTKASNMMKQLLIISTVITLTIICLSNPKWYKGTTEFYTNSRLILS